MKKILLTAAVAALAAAPAFADAPEVFGFAVDEQGRFHSAPPSSSVKPPKGAATWSRAAAPGRKARWASPVMEEKVMKPVKKYKKKRHHRKYRKMRAPLANPAPRR